jgi:hypothetical protein
MEWKGRSTAYALSRPRSHCPIWGRPWRRLAPTTPRCSLGQIGLLDSLSADRSLLIGGMRPAKREDDTLVAGPQCGGMACQILALGSGRASTNREQRHVELHSPVLTPSLINQTSSSPSAAAMPYCGTEVQIWNLKLGTFSKRVTMHFVAVPLGSCRTSPSLRRKVTAKQSRAVRLWT